MRLLLLNHNYRFSGTYYRAMPIAEQMAKRGHQVTLMTVSPQHRWRPIWSHFNGVSLREMPNFGQDWGEGYGPLDNFLRSVHVLSNHYDIIHMFDHKPNATFPAFIGRCRRVKLVADWADWWGGIGGINDVSHRRFPPVEKFEGWWEEKSKIWADGIVTISNPLKQRALNLGCSSHRLLYLPTGAPSDRIYPIAGEKARQYLSVPLRGPLIGFIGQGDLEIAIEALRQLSGVNLMIIGRENPRITNLANTYGLTSRLWQTGFIADDQVGLYLACADVMILPMTDRAANRGRFPNKLLDYLAAGRPTVASPIGDIKMIFEKYPLGLLAGEGDFATAINHLFAEPLLREEMGMTARRIAETVFDWKILADHLDKFYQSLLKN